MGRSKLIPKPFTPLVAEPTRCETPPIRYDWQKDSIFPRVRVKGKEILAAPLALMLRSGEGVEAPIEVTSFGLKSRSVEQAVYKIEANVGAIGTLSAVYAWGNRQIPRPGYLPAVGEPPAELHYDLWIGPSA